VDYYEKRAAAYDQTSWDHPDGDPRVAQAVRTALSSLSPESTLDIGCGTGYVSRWLPGQLTLLDASPAMLAIAARRLPKASLINARVPPLPLASHRFGRAFAANLYGHLPAAERIELIREMRRVADEIVILDQLAGDGRFREGPEERELLDGSTMTIHKCYFTVPQLLLEVGGGDVLMAGPVFALVRAAGQPPK
jgi:ubiquinone/menaquinone biosynthesis C-methylase UbiE